MWFFFISVSAHFSSVAKKRMRFAMNWYSFIFPNTALTTATFGVANALGGNRAFRIVGCILTVALIITWTLVFSMMIRAVYLKQILWPQMQEDRDEGGWGKDDKKRNGDVMSALHSRQHSFMGHPKNGRGGGGALNSPMSDSPPVLEMFDPVKTKDMQDAERGRTGWMSWAKSGQERDRRRGFMNGSASQLDSNADLTRIEKMEKDVNPRS
jgi:hypothetical protein